MCASTKHSEFTLCSMHESYNRLNPDNALSHKCIHKQLLSDESLSTVKSLLGEALTLFQSKAFYRDLKKTLPNDLDTLLSEPIFLKRVYVPSRFICFTASDGQLNYSTIKPISKAPVFRVLTLLTRTSSFCLFSFR